MHQGNMNSETNIVYETELMDGNITKYDLKQDDTVDCGYKSCKAIG